jgi:signal transduction histidine kinase
MFFVWVLFSVIWMVANYMENVSFFSFITRSVLLRADFAAAAMASGFIPVFISSFIDRKASLKKTLRYAIPAVILAGMSFTKLTLSRIQLSSDGDIMFAGGVGFYFYAAAVIFYFIYPYYLLSRVHFSTASTQHAQISAISKGLALTAVVALTVNLFLQNYLSVELFRIGVYSVLFLAIGVSWAIVKHEFLRIRFVVVEVLLLGILSTMLARVVMSAFAPKVSMTEVTANSVMFLVMLILGFAMVRSFLNEERQRENLQLLDDSLEKTNKHLLELDVLKNTMLSVAAHQLRGPLGGVRGYLTMMRDGDLGPISDKQSEALSMNLNVLSRLMNAVETFLDIGMLEAGKVSLRLETVALDDLVAAIVEEFDAPMRRKGLALSFRCLAAKPVLVNVDPDKTKHVIFNIIDNAMKYTEIGSVSVTLEVKDASAKVRVTDTGPGLSAEELAHLFQKFERGQFVPDRGGSGLGLYVVKMLTEMQGGHVQAESAGVGQGAVFSVTFPLAKSA